MMYGIKYVTLSDSIGMSDATAARIVERWFQEAFRESRAKALQKFREQLEAARAAGGTSETRTNADSGQA